MTHAHEIHAHDAHAHDAHAHDAHAHVTRCTPHARNVRTHVHILPTARRIKVQLTFLKRVMKANGAPLQAHHAASLFASASNLLSSVSLWRICGWARGSGAGSKKGQRMGLDVKLCNERKDFGNMKMTAEFTCEIREAKWTLSFHTGQSLQGNEQ